VSLLISWEGFGLDPHNRIWIDYLLYFNLNADTDANIIKYEYKMDVLTLDY
jgi:hypothetical protein